MKMLMKEKLWVIVSSFVVAIVLVFAFQLLIYLSIEDSKDRQQEKLDFVNSILWQIVSTSLDESVDSAGETLEKETIPSIVKGIDSYYNGFTSIELEHDLANLGNVEYNNPIVNIIHNNINGKYFNGIKTDSNDIFVLTKNNGIIIDPSISSSTEDRPISLEAEAERHYNPALAQTSFDEILSQNYQRKYIFWQFYEPENLNENKIKTMRLYELENAFKESNGNLDTLRSYEFLVPKYIYIDKDIMGNKLVNNRGIRQNIQQIVLVQSINIAEVIENDSVLADVYKSVYNDDLYKIEDIQLLSKVQTALLIFGIMVLIILLNLSIRFNDYRNEQK